jgi:hypothetical protein
MKKLLLIALLAVVAATGGVFAYTFTTATATIGVTAIESDFANITASTYSAPDVFGSYTGTWDPGTLFDISPHGEYTGDLVIHVYLVNTGELIRQYHHLNMTIEFQDNTDTAVDERGMEQVLTLQNADVSFYWDSGNGTSPYAIELTGGGYRLHKWKSLTGGSVAPQLWCEITQR